MKGPQGQMKSLLLFIINSHCVRCVCGRVSGDKNSVYYYVRSLMSARKGSLTGALGPFAVPGWSFGPREREWIVLVRFYSERGLDAPGSESFEMFAKPCPYW